MSQPGGTALQVWLDCNLAPACLVGTLAHDRGQIRFRYERSWLNNSRAFALDPDLTLDDADNRPNLQTVLDTAGFYGLGTQRAQQIIEKVWQAVAGWGTAAQQLGMGAADRELMALAFSAHAAYVRYRSGQGAELHLGECLTWMLRLRAA